MDASKLKKFERHVKKLIVTLVEHRNNLQLHSNVDQFHYMQKLEELKLLLENANVAAKRYETEYAQLFCKWKTDVRLINKILKRELEVKQ